MFHRKRAFLLVFGLLLLVFTLYVIFDTFLIPRVYFYAAYEEVQTDTSSSVQTEEEMEEAIETVITATTYQDEHLSITMSEYRVQNSSVYVADIQVDDPSYLKTALAQNAYGKNVTEETSTIAESVNAILAINGDFYGSQEAGYVLRNGVLYRNTAESGQEDLVIYLWGWNF